MKIKRNRKKELDMGTKEVWKVALLHLLQTHVIYKEDEFPFQIGARLGKEF